MNCNTTHYRANSSSVPGDPTPFPRGTDGQSFARALEGDDDLGRPLVHASCALQDGFAVLDRESCFERLWPGRTLEPRLSDSWFGDSERRPDLVREVLHERQREPGLGHVHLSGAAGARAEALAAAGLAWSAAVEQRRLVLQREQRAPAPADARKP